VFRQTTTDGDKTFIILCNKDGRNRVLFFVYNQLNKFRGQRTSAVYVFTRVLRTRTERRRSKRTRTTTKRHWPRTTGAFHPTTDGRRRRRRSHLPTNKNENPYSRESRASLFCRYGFLVSSRHVAATRNVIAAAAVILLARRSKILVNIYVFTCCSAPCDIMITIILSNNMLLVYYDSWPLKLYILFTKDKITISSYLHIVIVLYT